MDGSFACPDCGCEVRLTGVSPGRMVRCDFCRSMVEVPYLTRAAPIRRLRESRARGRTQRRGLWPVWARVAVAVLLGAILIAGANRVVHSRRRSADAEAVTRLVEKARRDEAAGRLGPALAAADGALAVARKAKVAPAKMDGLRRDRDALARREAEAALRTLAGGSADSDPGRAVGLAQKLATRAGRDPALEGLGTSVLAELQRLRLLWVEADLAAAAAALAANQPVRAWESCLRASETAADLAAEPRRRLLAESTVLARRLIAAHGTVLEPVRGQFTLGTPKGYEALLFPGLVAALRGRGYLTRPDGSDAWDDLWSSVAPYKVTVEVSEHQETPYLQSPNHLCRIDARLELTREGSRLWHEAPTVRTEVPLPGLPAYQASRLAVSNRRSPDFEKLLYDNARDNLVERLSFFLRNLPPCPTASAGARPAV